MRAQLGICVHRLLCVLNNHYVRPREYIKLMLVTSKDISKVFTLRRMSNLCVFGGCRR